MEYHRHRTLRDSERRLRRAGNATVISSVALSMSKLIQGYDLTPVERQACLDLGRSLAESAQGLRDYIEPFQWSSVRRDPLFSQERLEAMAGSLLRVGMAEAPESRLEDFELARDDLRRATRLLLNANSTSGECSHG